MSITEELIETLIAKIEALEALIKILENRSEDKRYKDLVDASEVCDLLYITSRTLLTYREQGLLPCIQIGSKFYYDPKEIKNLIDSKRKTN